MAMAGARAIPSRLRRLQLRGAGASRWVLPVLSLALVGTALLATGHGAVSIAPRQVVAIILDHLGADTGDAYSQQQDAVRWAIRLPRVVRGCLIDAALGASGAALQGIFRNPLAEPALAGVAGGGSHGAVATIVPGFGFLGRWSLPAAAFAGAFLVTLVVYGIAPSNGRTSVETLILMGVAMNAITGAVTGYLISIADDGQLRDITFWSLGSLGGATRAVVRVAAPVTLPAGLLILRWGWALNLLVLVESEARHLGVNTEQVRLTLIALSALMTGTAVAMAGIIGFIGLVVPHLVRLLVGPDHRTLVVPAGLPLGVVTALLGGPFFLWLLYRTS